MTLECFETSINRLSILPKPEPETEPVRTLPTSDLVPMLWSGLKRGSFRIVEATTGPSEVSLTVAHAAEVPAPSVTKHRAAMMLEEVLRGRSQKVVAMELGVAFSTVALGLKEAIERMGLSGRFTRLPLAVPLLAHAARRPGMVSLHVEGDLPSQLVHECVIRIERTEGVFAQQLSPCELGVASALLEGKSYDEIGVLRGVSLRTIANQMCAVGKKLGTRGRFDLLRASVERSAPTIPVAAPTSPPSSGAYDDLEVRASLVG